ncbi:MAG: nucleotidyltransferase family protein [Bacteroidales bacterium]|jgi:hypothetical protein|nr:nucleotidyltransferase family protein [Bacteroidales bacterium]
MAENDDHERAVRLILLLSRVEFLDDEKRQIVAGVSKFSGWKLFTILAIRHGVAALIWQNIRDLSLEDKVPEPERIILEGLRVKSIARVAYISSVADGVAKMLEEEGIRVVLLKGLALEHMVYGSRGLRQMSDADLLVAPGNALRARDILVREGFISMPMKSPIYRHIVLDLGNHLPELHRGGVSVDLHYRLFGPGSEEMVNRAVEESEEITEGGTVLYVLAPLTAFLGLVSHIRKHEVKGEFQLRLWSDIYLLLKKYGGRIINDTLPAAAEQAGISREVRAVMTIMEQVWGLQIPSVMRALPGSDEERRAGRFMHELMYPGSVMPVSQRAMFTSNIRSMNSFRKKMIFILGDIFPSVDFMKRRYGCRSTLLALLYYPHRLGKLAWLLGLPAAKSQND